MNISYARLSTIAAAIVLSAFSHNTAEAFWGRRVVTSYALPSVPATTYGYAPIVTTGYAPIITARPVIYGAPIVTASPVVTAGYAPTYAAPAYFGPAVTANYAPVYAPAPVSAPVTAYYPAATYAPAPVTTYYAPAAATGVIIQRPVVVRRPYYVWP